MESLANLCVLLGLLGYIKARESMLAGKGGILLASASLVFPTCLGLLAKETAALLPLYGFLVEVFIYRFRRPSAETGAGSQRALVGMFVVILALPLVAGSATILPAMLQPQAWASRDFTLLTRLLSEARIVVDYIAWTLFPSPRHLSFYHDQFIISQGLLSPWTTLASIAILAGLVVAAVALRRKAPLAALGIALYLGCHSLTATVLPLELVYEHRNYFAEARVY